VTSFKVLLAPAVAALALLVGCAPAAPDSGRDVPNVRRLPQASASAPAPSPGPDFPAYAATVTGDRIAVRNGPAGRETSVLDNPLPSGAPLTFLLVQDQGEWLEVLLPVRPNGSTGWIRSAEVLVEGVPFRLDVRTADHALDLYEGDRLVRTYPIGIGKQDTPTPGGTFFLKELLQPPDANGTYGPYAYGLSGFSTTLETFAGADAVIGLHGTDDPGSIGKDVSSGCIRLHNADITELAQLLPLGTPVRILA
jgi:lipoprotein-anchoring transpeptidase ErfK/SrfK